MKVFRRIVVGLGVAMAALVLVWAVRWHMGVEVNPSVHPTGYVGQQSCAGCHPVQTVAWQQSHHAQSMLPAKHDTVLGNFQNTSFTVEGVSSTFFTRGNGFFVRIVGNKGSVEEFPIAYTFGVYPLQQYLVPFPDGRLQVLGVAWDSRPLAEGGQHWFSLYPDQIVKPGDALHWTGRDQNWNFMCAACHSSGLRKNYDESHDSYGTTWSDINVACEACHGPSSSHVAWANKGASSSDPTKGLSWINVSGSGHWGDFDRRGIRSWNGSARPDISGTICGGCHSRRRALTEGAKPGATFLDDFVPALLEPGLYAVDGQIEDEVFEYGSFLQSRMHAAGVGCSDCHDPHSATLRAKGNELCAQCHDTKIFDTNRHHHHQSGSEAAQCVTCHMPSRTYMRVHRRHDHSIRLPRPDLTLALGTPNACTQCHSDKPVQWAVAALQRWGATSMGRPHYATALALGRQGAPGAAEALSPLATARDQPAIIRATALEMLNNFPSETALAAATLALTDPDALVRLGGLRALEPYDLSVQQSLVSPLVHDPVKAVRIEAARILAPIADHSNLPQGLDEWLASELVALDRPETHLNLGTLWADLGDAAKAEAEFRAALTLDPHFGAASLNLADLYRSQNQDAKGEALLRQVIADAPDDADALYAWGLWLVRQQRIAEAVEPFQKASSLRPQDSKFSQALTLARQSRR